MAQSGNDGISRALIEAFVRKKLDELKRDPERSARGIIDMALNFSEGRFQKQFFGVAQNMLRNGRSGYYRLIQDIVNNVDSERLLTFGMNLGYNSFTSGAKIIRETEAARGYNIPWTIIIRTGKRKAMEDSRRRLIAEGKEIGIHTFVLFADEEPGSLLALAGENPDCAFALLCRARDMTGEFIDRAYEYKNLMLAAEYSSDIYPTDIYPTDEHPLDTGPIKTADICGILRERGMLYSVYVTYRADNAQAILSGGLLNDIGRLHPAFTLFLSGDSPEGSAGDKVRATVYDYIMSVREGQNSLTAPFDLWYDSRKIDAIISDDACAVLFDSDGNFCRDFTAAPDERYNYRNMPLSQILEACCPKRRRS